MEFTARSFSVELRFRIPTAIFWVPKSRILEAKTSKIPDSTGKYFRVSEIQIPLLGAIPLRVIYCCAAVLISGAPNEDIVQNYLT